MRERFLVVRGGGDLGSGVALRAWRAGFSVIIAELPDPVTVRRTVAFSEAIYEGRVCVEEAQAERVDDAASVKDCLQSDRIAVVVDVGCRDTCDTFRPFAVVDAVMAKRNIGTRKDWASLVIGLGPGFQAPVDVHAVVETQRGPDLGRVIYRGGAMADTGRPAAVEGHANDRVLRSPADGVLHCRAQIGDAVHAGQVVAEVKGVPVVATFRGLLRGLVRDGLVVKAGMKVGDVDPRVDPRLCWYASDKSLAVAGGVLEAILGAIKAERGALRVRDDA